MVSPGGYLTLFNHTKCVRKGENIAFAGHSVSVDHLWQRRCSSQWLDLDLDCEDEVEVFLHVSDKFTIKKIGVGLAYEKDVIITDNEDEVNDDAGAGAGVTDKRRRDGDGDGDGDEAGPSHGWSKRLKYEANVGNEQH
ncbi:hypothetical protein HS088_TW13G00807 [Tripterygium wilfordii]|uniref:Uncharacterized protein n=2 Tax=Tripterygium wilfordii TaxID=458696 RepID=A0A7J7CVI6_TRIWF|nr:hypothetical protein HS088_TW13G00807 [Tripterygium wilfordii]